MKTLVIIDMIRGFLEPGHPLYCGDKARSIIPNVVTRIREANMPSSLAEIYFVYDSHSRRDKEFMLFPPHCIEGTHECECIAEIYKVITNAKYVPKKTYNAFTKELLNIYCDNEIIICGVCTDICVLYTAYEAIKNGFNVTIYEDSVASFDFDAHINALKHMEKILGVNVIWN